MGELKKDFGTAAAMVGGWRKVVRWGCVCGEMGFGCRLGGKAREIVKIRALPRYWLGEVLLKLLFARSRLGCWLDAAAYSELELENGSEGST